MSYNSHGWGMGWTHWGKFVQIVEVELYLCGRWKWLINLPSTFALPPSTIPPATLLWLGATSSGLPTCCRCPKWATPPAPSMLMYGRARLGLWGWSHKVSKTRSLGRSTIRRCVSSGWAPSRTERWAAESTDACKALRASELNVRLIWIVQERYVGSRWEELDSATAAVSMSCWSVSPPLTRGALGSEWPSNTGRFGRGSGTMGQSVTALVSQEIKKERHKLMFLNFQKNLVFIFKFLKWQKGHLCACVRTSSTGKSSTDSSFVVPGWWNELP